MSNTATSGGIAYSTNFLQISFRNITALHGKSVTGGAMTLSNGGALDIYESVFVSNSAQNSGGALYLLYIDRVLLNRVIFSKNSAILDGGAVAIYGSLQVDPNDEENRQMKLAIENSNFTSNTVSRRGGAFYGNNILEARISHSQFSENKAAYGGAIFTAKSTGNISTSRFFSNLALSGGGAVYWLYEVNGPIVSITIICFLIH